MPDFSDAVRADISRNGVFGLGERDVADGYGNMSEDRAPCVVRNANRSEIECAVVLRRRRFGLGLKADGVRPIVYAGGDLNGGTRWSSA